jgi:hypothetical protein
MSKVEEFYDVESDPRFLGETRVERDARLAEVEGQRARVETQLSRVDAVMQTIESPGWGIVVEELTRARDAAETKMSRASSQDEFREAHGEKLGLGRLLDIERQVRNNHRRLNEELAQLLDEES